MDEVGQINSSLNLSTDDAVQSDNSFNNRSSSSAYSAEEEIIQQRGRRSPMKGNSGGSNSYNEHKINFPVPVDLFYKIKQTSMRSPEAKKFLRKIEPSGKRKSLLRTPVKRRLKRNVNFLPKLRKQDKRRKW